MHYAANLERARSSYRQEGRTINHQGPAHTQVVVAAAELSHNAAGRAFTLAQLYQHLGHPVAMLGSHFPQWGREPITLDGLKRLWTRLAVDLAQRFDGITVAKRMGRQWVCGVAALAAAR